MHKPRLDQRRAPIYEALERFRQMRVVPFDVPGHKHGRGNPFLLFERRKNWRRTPSAQPRPF